MAAWGGDVDAYRRDEGFTLVELMVTLVLFGILSSLAIMPLKAYRETQEHKGATRTLVSVLRNAQVRAVAEETTYQVSFSNAGHTATLARLNLGTGAYVTQSSVTSPSRVTYTASGGTSATPLFFYARGSATPGALRVTRKGSAKQYTITVEGLTARVSYA